METTDSPNAEQIRYWNDAAGPRWVTMQAALDAQLAQLGRLAMDRLDLRGGERVLDVGCGCGDSTLELADRVGATGHVRGVDISAPMLARARERAAAAGLGQVELLQADAQEHAFPSATADAVFSRFGVMFFATPEAAFRNLAGALRPGGRLAFVCWQPLPDNHWMMIPLMAVAQHLTLPPPPPPGAPGPFAFGDGERVRRILADAGFTNVALTDHRTTLTVGGSADLDETVEFVLQLGPTATAVRDATPEVRATLVDAVRTALTPYHDAQGVRMDAAAWIVTATRPA